MIWYENCCIYNETNLLKIPEIGYTEYKRNLILAKPIVVFFMNSWLFLLYFFPSFEATSEDVVGSRRKACSQISSQKGVPLPFHLVFIPLTHQRKKSQMLLLKEKQCVGVTKGKQAGGFLKKGEISLFAPYQQTAAATLNRAGLTE